MAAQECTWVGGVSSSYNTAGNWTGAVNRVPLDGDSIVFSGAVSRFQKRLD